MTREPANEQLSAWLDGELDEAEVAELEAEFARDPALRAEFEAIESVVQFVRTEGPSMAPMGFHHRVMSRIEQEHPERTSPWAWLRRPFGLPIEGWALGLAAAAALVVVLPTLGTDPEAPADPLSLELSPPTDAAPAAAQEVDDDAVAVVELPKIVSEPVRRPLAMPAVAAEPTPVNPDLVLPTVLGRASTGEPQPGAVAAGGTADDAPIVQGAPSVEGASGAAEHVRYRVQSDDPDMKLAMLKLAARYGKVTDLRRQPISNPEMAGPVEDLLVSLPQSELGAFAADLKRFGFGVEDETSDNLLQGSTVTVRITLLLSGGGPAQAAPPPNAARAAERAFDALEESP